MTNLRKAAEMALKDLTRLCHAQAYDTVEALRQALAEPEQEPVAWGFQNTAITGSNRWMYLRETIPADDQYRGVLWTPLYTAPPKREWVGLTDEEIYDYADKFLYQHGSNYGIKSFGKAIEAKLKEKNG